MAKIEGLYTESYAKTLFGFWVYLMTDCVLFASLFATYAVLQSSTAGGPSAKEIFSLPYALAETLILLTSSFTVSLGGLAARAQEARKTAWWFGLTFLLGSAFLIMEVSEYARLAAQGFGWQKSAFLSAYFTLAGTHVLHVAAGLLWMLILWAFSLYHGFTPAAFKRISCLKMFWLFLNVVWIFVFTFVYLIGTA